MARKTKGESEQTRERILDAAEAEMLERGVAQASLERIARRADVTRGAIYWHFQDKSCLLAAMVARTKLPLRDLRRCLIEHIPGVKPLPLLREMILHGVHRLATDEQHRRVCHIALHRCEIDTAHHATARVIDAIFEDTRTVLLSICQEIADDVGLATGLTPEDASDVIISFMAGQYDCSLRHPDTYHVADNAPAKVDALLAGLFPARVAVAAV